MGAIPHKTGALALQIAFTAACYAVAMPDHVPSRIERDLAAIRKLLEVLYRLRAPDGCPWDREQTVRSLAPYVLEEAFEAADAIGVGRPDAIREELGDCLMNVMLTAMAGESEALFTPEEVAHGIAAKLVKRHPHVFGDRVAQDAEQAWANWERIKAEEKASKQEDHSAISGVPAALPACLRALRVVEKAGRAGFRYTDLTGPERKVEEEWGELRQAVSEKNAARIEEELGDLLLAVVVYGSFVKANPEMALRGAIERFSQRFRFVETTLGTALKEAPLEQLLAIWKQAKEQTSR